MPETERKFRPDPASSELRTAISGASEKSISQGYLLVSDAGEVRIRQSGDRCLLTLKKGRGLQREEYEGEVSGELFDKLWPATVGARVRKRRYTAPLQAGTDTWVMMEIDEFADHLAGLVLIEVEFDSATSAEAFHPPAWFGPEVTGDPRYLNQSLARSHDSRRRV